MPCEGSLDPNEVIFRSMPPWGVAWTIRAGAVVHPRCAAVRMRPGLWPLAVLRDAEHCAGMLPRRGCGCPIKRSSLETNDGRARVDPPASSGRAHARRRHRGCYLVDPASSHMLVSKIKPCMCKYELIQTVKLRMAH